jgi:hypothetical protein
MRVALVQVQIPNELQDSLLYEKEAVFMRLREWSFQSAGSRGYEDL